MTESSVPVDLLNLGQVLACVGLLECEAIKAASAREASVAGDPAAAPERATGHFAPDAPGGTGGSFVMSSPNGVEIAGIVDDLAKAEAVALRPHGHELHDAETGTEDFVPEHSVFPAAPPEKNSALPVEIRADGWQVRVTSWAEGRACRRDNGKLWAGNTTGAKLTALALSLVRGAPDNERVRAAEDPFSFDAPQSSSYRLDWRRDYVPQDAGFSPNDQASVTMVGFPLVELLGIIGLEHARPRRPDPNDKLRCRYAVPRDPLPLSLMRAVVADAETGLPRRRFEATLDWPGKEGQSRCIETIREL